MQKRFPTAPWSALLKSMSIIASLLLIGAGCVVWQTIPAIGASNLVAVLAACSFPGIALAALLFVVTGYEIDGNQLHIQRLLWRTRIDLTSLQEARTDPAASQGAIRTAGNGGLFSFTGYYRSPRLGPYEAYVTNSTYSVVIKLLRRVIVVSPADPAAFVRELQARFPGLIRDSG
ncbi:MAG TPA: PH domain-containing protein [Rhodanobacter sp.]|nr:PH domain-containing protein [Rhodanobacter sp.]